VLLQKSDYLRNRDHSEPMTSNLSVFKFDYPWLQGSPDTRPLASFTSVNLMMVFYWAIVVLGSYLMKNRKPNENPFWLTMPQNFIMCIYSLYAFLGMFETLWRNWTLNGSSLFMLVCDPKHDMMVDMDYWMYTFYLSKYFEYFDSIVLILKGKALVPPGNAGYLLHIYHHSITANIVWIGWRRDFTVAWVGPVTNTFVHFFMYGYYLLVELKLLDKKYGGRFITPIQLLQFVLCLSLSVYESIFPAKCNSLEMSTVLWLWANYVIFFLFFYENIFSKTRRSWKFFW